MSSSGWPQILPRGVYNIENVSNDNMAHLPSGARGALLTARPSKSDNNERWAITLLDNGKYTIRNQLFNTYASVSAVVEPGEPVLAAWTSQEWRIIPSDVPNEYSIVTPSDADSLAWCFTSGQAGTNVTLTQNNQQLARCRWRIGLVDAPRPRVQLPLPLAPHRGATSNYSAPRGQPRGAIQQPEEETEEETEEEPVVIPLEDGVYTIKNRKTGNEWALDNLSEQSLLVAPLVMYHSNNLTEETERRFQVEVNKGTGAVKITSTYYHSLGYEDDHRHLSDGPNFRDAANECRLFKVPDQPSTFHVCTDTRKKNAPVMVLHDPHKGRQSRLFPISQPMNEAETRQHWVFTPV